MIRCDFYIHLTSLYFPTLFDKQLLSFLVHAIVGHIGSQRFSQKSNNYLKLYTVTELI